MGEPGDRFRIVEDAELALLANDTRQDPDAVDRMLHRDFVEIGRSGRLWRRADTLSSLRSEDARESPVVDEWRFEEISADLILVTYRLRTSAGQSRHSSIWDLAARPPQIRFHQGTVIPPPTP
ncbi:MAG: DUF4440 domain-containing protein [Actinobacteria bacterium]|nr:DUF4440 domain-containing protein [Actinomycetota bacterium]MCB0910245.1 DUF4440 domain-containing protein [Propionibacteriaceae bacterium]